MVLKNVQEVKMCQKVNNSLLQNIKIIKVFLHNKMNFESASKKKLAVQINPLSCLRNLSVVAEAVMVDRSEVFREGKSNWEARLWLLQKRDTNV